jgi:hypothetical protein
VSGHDALEKRRRISEETYFAREEQELIEKLRRKAELTAEHKEIGEAAGLADDELIADLMKFGFKRETISLLHLVPLIQLAWASDSVSSRERAAIVEAARSRGVVVGTMADAQLTAWLDVRPTDEFFESATRAIRGFLTALSAEEWEAGVTDIVACCTAVAKVSGGVLGLGSKVCDGERAVLSKVAAELARGHQEEADAFEAKLN